jgi:uncharacterized protein YndB with AHSA1/START domain
MVKIEITATLSQPIEKAWDAYTQPEHIVNWNFASDTWHCPKATNDVRVGGKLCARMEAKDGSMGFDFEGTYDEIKEHKLLSYQLEDGRSVQTTFTESNGQTEVTTVFDAEDENSAEMQKQGWQAILNNFKSYAESL